MAKVIAKNASLGIDDSAGTCRALTSFANQVTLTLSAETPEVTGFGDNSRQRLQDGLKDGELTFDATLATGANETDIVLFGIYGASTRYAFGPAGSSSGCTMYSASAILSRYEMRMGVADAGQCSGTLVLRSGSVTRATFGS